MGGMFMSPIMCMCVTFDAYLRERFPALFMAAVLADASIYLQPIADMFKRVGPGTPEILIGGERWWAIFVWRIDDLGGISKGVNASKFPARYGACIQCTVLGIWCKHLKTSIYIGAITKTGMADLRRRAFAALFESLPAVAALASSQPMTLMTKASARESAHRVETQALSKEQLALEAYHGYNVWTETLKYWDQVFQNINDPFHEIANTIRDIFNILRSNNGKSGGQHFSVKRRDFEREYGRFTNDDESKNWRPDFQTSLDAQRLIDKFVQSRVLRLPTGWPAARYVFDKLNRLSCSELLLMAGPGSIFSTFLRHHPFLENTFHASDRMFGAPASKRTHHAITERSRDRACLSPVKFGTYVAPILEHLRPPSPAPPG